MILSIAETIWTVLILVTVGYVLYRVKWIQNDGIKLLTRLAVYIATPCLAINSLYDYVTPEQLSDSWLAVLIVACGMLFGAFLSWLGGRFARVPEKRRGHVMAMGAFPNVMFVGFPIVTGILGDACVPYVMYYFMTIRIMIWTFGLYFIRRDALGKKVPLLSKDSLKGLLNAPVITFLVCLLLVSAQVRLPEWIHKTCGYFGNMVTPLSLIMIGAVMGRCGIKKSLKFERGMETILLSRFVFAPLATFALAYFCGFEPIGVQALTLVAAMPVMSQAVILCEQYGGDSDFAAKNIVVTTILCL